MRSCLPCYFGDFFFALTVIGMSGSYSSLKLSAVIYCQPRTGTGVSFFNICQAECNSFPLFFVVLV